MTRRGGLCQSDRPLIEPIMTIPGVDVVDRGSELSDSLSAGSAGSLNLRTLRGGGAIETTGHGAMLASPQFETTPSYVAALALKRIIKHWNAPHAARSIL